MSIFKNPVIATEDEIKTLTPEDLKGFGEKYDGLWYFVIFADNDDKRIVCAFAAHKNYKKAMKIAMKKAIERIGK